MADSPFANCEKALMIQKNEKSFQAWNLFFENFLRKSNQIIKCRDSFYKLIRSMEGAQCWLEWVNNVHNEA